MAGAKARTCCLAGGFARASATTEASTGPSGPECNPRPQITRAARTPRRAHSVTNAYSFRRATSACSLCKSHRAANPNSPRRSAARVSLDTPNDSPTVPSGPRSTCKSCAGAIGGSAGEATGERGGTSSKSTAEIRFAPWRNGRTPANSRSNMRRSSSSDGGFALSDGSRPVGLRGAMTTNHTARALRRRYFALLAEAAFSSR